MADFSHLHQAVKDQDLGEVQRLLSQGHDIGEKNPKTGINSLHLAVLTENYDIVELLSRDEAHIDSTWRRLRGYDCEGYTALHFSVYVCNKNITQLLLSRNAGVNKQTDIGNTALHIAASQGYLFGEIKLDLLLNGNRCYSKNNNTYTQRGITMNERILSMKGYCDITDILLQSGADAEFVNENGNTALHLACLLEDDTIARRILKKCRSIVNYYNRDEKTALHIAANSDYNYTELVKLLIECGADVDETDRFRCTPLYYACVKRNLDVVRILVENRCNVNIGGNCKPIDIAVKHHCDEKIFKLLLKHGANTSHLDFYFISQFARCPEMDYIIILFETYCNVFFKTNRDICYKSGNFYSKFVVRRFELFKLLLQHVCLKYVAWKHSIFTDLLKYLIKMKTLGCFIARDYPDIDSLNMDLKLEDEVYKDNCKKEVEILKGIFVCSDISIVDFLKKDLNKMVRLLKNQEVVNVLKCFNNKEFPIYGELINKFFELGMERRSMLNQCYECFNVIFCQFPKLPDMIVENIFNYFTTEDMKILNEDFMVSI